jgi:class 3 adenylate cyclase
LETNDIGYGYGSLGCGSNILFAEALLSHGAELHVVLPFRKEEFIQLFVTPGGPLWVNRFQSCLDKATTVNYATDESFLGDQELFKYASHFATGLALLRGSYLDTSVQQIVPVTSGTKPPVCEFMLNPLSQKSSDSLALPLNKHICSGKVKQIKRHWRTSGDNHQRRLKAFLFGDFKGFSRLEDSQIPAFVEHLGSRVSEVIKKFEHEILKCNTWGDGLFVVMNDAIQAAHCALDLQDMMTLFDHSKYSLPTHISLRLGGHIGPVFELRDPILKNLNYFGTHVTRTARIEPVTPVGQVYITEYFAAEIARSEDHSIRCEYAGKIPAAKGYGHLAMYSLKKVIERESTEIMHD